MPHCTSPLILSSLSRTARSFIRVVQSISDSAKLYPSCFPFLYPAYLEQREALSELFPFLVRRVVWGCVSLTRRAVRLVGFGGFVLSLLRSSGQKHSCQCPCGWLRELCCGLALGPGDGGQSVPLPRRVAGVVAAMDGWRLAAPSSIGEKGVGVEASSAEEEKDGHSEGIGGRRRWKGLGRWGEEEGGRKEKSRKTATYLYPLATKIYSMCVSSLSSS